MDRKLVAEVRASINRAARAERRPVSVRHVCLACRRALDATGVSVTAMGELGVGELLFATDPRTEELAELQATVGEGPGLDALAIGRPVLVHDLAAEPAGRRWPLFAPGAVELGVAAVYAFPLQLGVISMGVLKVNRTEPGWPTPRQLSAALLYADAAVLQLLTMELRTEPAGVDGIPGASRFVDGYVDQWAVVHQATGMISVQLGTDVKTAFVQLRAHAYSQGRRLTAVAHDVLAGRLRFDPDPDPGPG